jgi:hypothetical protein
MIVLGSRGLSVCQHPNRSHVLFQPPIHRFEGVLVKLAIVCAFVDSTTALWLVLSMSYRRSAMVTRCKFMIRACGDNDFLSMARVILLRMVRETIDSKFFTKELSLRWCLWEGLGTQFA